MFVLGHNSIQAWITYQHEHTFKAFKALTPLLGANSEALALTVTLTLTISFRAWTTFSQISCHGLLFVLELTLIADINGERNNM